MSNRLSRTSRFVNVSAPVHHGRRGWRRLFPQASLATERKLRGRQTTPPSRPAVVRVVVSTPKEAHEASLCSGRVSPLNKAPLVTVGIWRSGRTLHVEADAHASGLVFDPRALHEIAQHVRSTFATYCLHFSDDDCRRSVLVYEVESANGKHEVREARFLLRVLAQPSSWRFFYAERKCREVA